MVVYQKGNKKLNEVSNMAEGNKPLKTYRAGGLSITAWQNEKEIKGKKVMVKSFQLQKRWKDGEEWKDTKNLNLNDLPKVQELMRQAYADSISKAKDEDE